MGAELGGPVLVNLLEHAINLCDEHVLVLLGVEQPAHLMRVRVRVRLGILVLLGVEQPAHL